MKKDSVLKLPEQNPRVETGPVRFGNDWTGVFIRGDNALFFAMAIEQCIENNNKIHPMNKAVLKGLADTLRMCAE